MISVAFTGQNGRNPFESKDPRWNGGSLFLMSLASHIPDVGVHFFWSLPLPPQPPGSGRTKHFFFQLFPTKSYAKLLEGTYCCDVLGGLRGLPNGERRELLGRLYEEIVWIFFFFLNIWKLVETRSASELSRNDRINTIQATIFLGISFH